MVKRKPQYVKIKEYIILYIEDEKYNENEQIESEHALCELFGVTRMTVRQALTDLIPENIIYSVPKVGPFVCKKSKKTKPNQHLNLPHMSVKNPD